MGRVTVCTIREPEFGKPEIFFKTDDGGEFVYSIPVPVLLQIHNQTGVYLQRSFCALASATGDG
jgi:hypothetical protein